MSIYYVSTELSHHGVKGQKWGVRKDARAMASSRVAKEGGTKYGIYYGRFGGESIRNASGKKMSRKTQRALEKSIKNRDIQEYRKMKNLKNKANSGMAYMGNSATMAMAVTLVNAATQGSRESAKTQYQKMIIDEGNRYVDELMKRK